MEGFFKIAAATPQLSLGNTVANAKELVRLAENAAKDGVSAIVFPELCLTGYTCGDMFFRDDLLHAASEAADIFATATANLPLVSVVGLPSAEGSAIYNAAAVVYGGKIVGIVRKRALPNYGEYYERRQFTPAPADEPLSIFDVGAFRFGVEICEDLWTPVPPSSLMAEGGVDVVFNLSASTDFLGKSQRRQSLVEQQSLRFGRVELRRGLRRMSRHRRGRADGLRGQAVQRRAADRRGGRRRRRRAAPQEKHVVRLLLAPHSRRPPTAGHPHRQAAHNNAIRRLPLAIP